MAWLLRILVLFTLVIGPAYAQQAPDPTFLQGVIQALEIQRNTALNMQASAEARERQYLDRIAKLEARIKELEAKDVK